MYSKTWWEEGAITNVHTVHPTLPIVNSRVLSGLGINGFFCCLLMYTAVSPEEYSIVVSPEEYSIAVSSEEYSIAVSPEEYSIVVSPEEYPYSRIS
jgi:hypothetical protein